MNTTENFSVSQTRCPCPIRPLPFTVGDNFDYGVLPADVTSQAAFPTPEHYHHLVFVTLNTAVLQVQYMHKITAAKNRGK